MKIPKITFQHDRKTLEFMRDLSSIESILKTLIAFANTAGGTLLIGLDNNGSIVGIEDIFAAEEKIANAIADSISPPLKAPIEIVSDESKTLLLIRVAHWKGPFYLKEEGKENGVYVRLGSTNQVAGPELIAELNRPVNTTFDQEPCPDIDEEGLDRERIDQAFSKVGCEVNLQKLETLGILVPYAGKLVCSKGGLILFSKDQLRKKYFPNSTVRCTRFNGVGKGDYIEQYDCQGTIIDAVKEISNFIQRNTKLIAKFEKNKRKEIPEYSQITIHEVLINALAHADYSIQGINPRVSIYSNRIEIENPGMLPFGYIMDDFTSGISHIRNKVIARVFQELGLMKEWGTGYKKITETTLSNGYPMPRWDEVGTSMRVNIMPYVRPYEGFGYEMFLSENESGMSLSKQKISVLLQHKEQLSAKSIYENFQLV